MNERFRTTTAGDLVQRELDRAAGELYEAPDPYAEELKQRTAADAAAKGAAATGDDGLRALADAKTERDAARDAEFRKRYEEARRRHPGGDFMKINLVLKKGSNR